MITLDELGRFICQRCAHKSIRHWELLYDCLDCEMVCSFFMPRLQDEELIDQLFGGELDEMLRRLGGWE